MKRLFICCCAASFAMVNLADENHGEVASGKSEEIFVFFGAGEEFLLAHGDKQHDDNSGILSGRGIKR